MLHRIDKITAVIVLAALFWSAGSIASPADQEWEQVEAAPQIDVVIALDVSSSMSGLISSAKQRLWDIVNQLGRAQPQPTLRISIMSYGNPGYGRESGFVRIDLPFTNDLDVVNQTLFSFTTNGGDEYVARAIATSVGELDWSTEPNALRILFVAGNEPANQDPQVSIRQATQAAIGKGIVVNTIFCGSEDDSVAGGWRDVAAMTNGLYAAIDQNSAAVANISTPMDQELVELNQALNETYIAYGDAGAASRANQIEQDTNAESMSHSAMASRAVTKAGRLYDNSRWDLVDAVGGGKALEEIDVEDLPEPMKTMDDEERDEYVRLQSEKREELQAEIQELDKERQEFIEKERKLQAENAPKGLDAVIQEGLKSIAEDKGFTFDGATAEMN